MKKINRPEDLPEWFELDSYHAARDFGPVEWLACLRKRKKILEFLSGLENVKLLPSEVYKIRPEVRNELDAIRRSPLDIVSGENFAPDDTIALPVRRMNSSDLPDEPWSDCVRFEFKRGAEVESKGFMPVKMLPFLSNNELDGSLNLRGEMHVSLLVDMRGTDAVLIKAFKVWLKNARALHYKAHRRKRPAYEQWSRYGLLPYLDLLIWSRETGIQIPHQVMAEAVDYRKGGDSFRKTIPKLASSLMQDLGELEALAASELRPEAFEP